MLPVLVSVVIVPASRFSALLPLEFTVPSLMNEPIVPLPAFNMRE